MECAAKQLGGCLDRASGCSICCAKCGAVWYCSRFHQRKHWRDHRAVCDRMAQQRACWLSDSPFLFELKGSTCAFLDKRGLHGKGLWRGECACFPGQSSHRDSSWHLPSNACPCKGPRNDLEAATLKDWKQYYEWRELPLDSPAALLLHWPLTIYYAFNQANLRKKKITIHYLGPERELQQLEVFGELLALFPGVQIHIDFVGPAVPTSSHKRSLELTSYPKCLDSSCECKRTRVSGSGLLTLSTWKGFYHDIHHQIPRPDLVVAPNAGVAAFISWKPTIELLLKVKVPVFFTDFCEEACVLSVQCIDSLEPNQVSFPITDNPFRHPLVPSNRAIDLPMHANGFVFGLLFDGHPTPPETKDETDAGKEKAEF